jgi:hypothetical protein
MPLATMMQDAGVNALPIVSQWLQRDRIAAFEDVCGL